jgi:acyl-CoA synthetase (AMP-forming)/AMP-acid ligase II
MWRLEDQYMHRTGIVASDEKLIEVTTLGDLLLRAAQRWPGRELLVLGSERLTYGQLSARAQRTARALQGMGVRPGDHLGILAPNLVEVIELLFASALSGAVAVLINARYKVEELRYVIANGDLRLLFTTRRIANYVDFVDLLYGALPGLRETGSPLALTLEATPRLQSVVLMEDSVSPGLVSWPQFDAHAEHIDATQAGSRRSAVALREPCIMMYTSGTTADPKGCRLSHEAIVRSANEIRARFRLTEGDRQWNPLPMFHMSSVMPLLATMWAGGRFITDTHFDADAAWEVLEKEQPTVWFTAFPAVMSAILNHPCFTVDRVPWVRLIINVAPPDQLRRNMKAIPHAVHISAYGMTEAAGISCFGCIDEDDDTRAATCGPPLPGVQLRVVDLESGAPAPSGTAGEMTIRGYSLFEGYYKSPEKNREAFDAEGWFHTGDLCVLDTEGRVAYRGRIKDMLKVGGENVAAVEIESFLCRHPSVQLAQVVGVPDARYGEVAAAFVELRPGTSCSVQEITDFCRDHIATFKIPRYVRFVNSWPMSATKIQKFRLREALAAELTVGDGEPGG